MWHGKAPSTRLKSWAVVAALLCGALGLLDQASAADTAIPSNAPYRHMGVASCSMSVCHGNLKPQTGRDVQLNEYRTWQLQDRHAQAFRRLNEPLGKSIAQKMGLANAQAAQICIDCHADNVPVAVRGPQFQLSDGVGCEACHGGAERWIKSHAQKDATHPANLALGMYATETPARRAQLCLSCHQGTATKFVTHQMIGAGHPRLRFELDAYTSNQPAHFVVDDDYIKRKGRIPEANLWLTGQLEAARGYAALLQSRFFSRPGLFPELAFYDCFGCHHSVDKNKLRWTPERAGVGVAPGSLRLQKQHDIMLQVVAEALSDAATARDLAQSVTALTLAGQSDATAMRSQASRLTAWLDAREPWTRRAFSNAEINQIRRGLLQYAAADRASDYLAAEQVVLGVESLSLALNDRDRHAADIDALYSAVDTTGGFDPAQFAAVARQKVGRF
jgi:hypothetical protein